MKKFLLLCQTLFFIFIFNDLNGQYCTPAYTNGCELGQGLTQFSLNTISQAIPCSGIPNYYHDYTVVSTSLAKNGYYLISVQSSNAGLYVSVWIDYDNSTSFNNAEELVQQFICTGAGITFSYPVTIPNTVATGATRLRIMSSTNGYPSNPCANPGFGNSCDFSVNIIASATPPTVITQGATAVTSSTAQLNGSVNAQNNLTNVEFHYGLDATYGTIVGGVPGTVTGNSATAVSAALSGLLPNTTYHYKVVGFGAGGYISGGDVTFTTNPVALPVVVTGSTTSITGFTATLNGTVNANNSTSAVSFEYGTDLLYGRTATGYPPSVSSNSPEPIIADISGLDLNTTYHYRIVATNAAGTSYGSDMTFTTLPHQYCTPTYTSGCNAPWYMGLTYVGFNTIEQTITCTGTPSYYHDYTSTSVDLAQGVSYAVTVTNVSGYTMYIKVWIDYNHDNVFDVATETAGSGYCYAASTTPIQISVSGSALTGTTGLRILANYGGYPTDPCGSYTYGNCSDFSVNILTSATPATVTTLAASGISGSDAILNGTINANNFSAAVFFDYGTTTSYSTTLNAAPYIVTGSSPASVNAGISGLLPNTVYHFRARAQNAGGITNGSDMTLTSAALMPVVTTTAATGIGGTSATVSGTVNPNNATSSVSFDYGLTTSYTDNVTGTPSSVNGYSTQSALASIAGLALNTTYHYRIISTNVAGTTYGNDMTFTTLPTQYCLPVFTNGCNAPWYMGLTYVGLNTIDQNIPCSGTPSYYHDYTSTSTDLALGVSYAITASNTSSYTMYCTVWIDYNHNNIFDVSTETAGTGYINPTTTSTIAITVSGSALTGATGLRVMANYGGYPTDPCGSYTYGNCQDFTVNILSGATPPTVTSIAASGIAGLGATLNGTINANGYSAATFFDYGTTTSYSTTLNATPYIVPGSSPTGINAAISGLLPNTVYHFRARAQNAGGGTNGSDLTFTSNPIPPVVTTTAATSLGGTSATLNGTINPNNSTSSASFEYGLTTSYTNTVTGNPPSVSSGYNAVAVSALIIGLDYNTIYHYRVVSTNVAGTTYGNDMTFTTMSVPFCIPVFTNGCNAPWYMGITYFGLNTISQIIPCSGTPSYYHDYTSSSTNLALNGSYAITASNESSYTMYIKVWIDYNQNNFFDGESEVAGTGYVNPTTTSTIPITVSGSALTGTTRLRVLANYGGYPTDGCGSYTYGNCNDFSVYLTPPGPPSVSTVTASSVKVTTATVNGLVNALGFSTAVSFEYGLTDSYGSTKTATPTPVTGGITTAVSGALTGLLPNSTYHYRIKGVSSQGTSYGSDMTFLTLSSTTTQTNVTPINLGAFDQQILGIEIYNLNPSNPVEATSFTFNTNGCTKVSDLSGAKVFYTGTSGAFATGTQFGSEVTSFGILGSPFSITSTQALSTGTNYFWLTYSISSGATPLDYVDAECTSVTVGNDMVPSITAPAGNRQIIDDKFLQSITVTQASSASVIKGSSNNEILRLDFNVTGTTNSLPLNSIVVTNNGYDSDIAAGGVKLYRTSTPIFATTNLLGTAQSFSSLAATFSSLAYDLPNGHTYVWICYDIAGGATGFHLADGKITQNSINVNGTLYPVAELNPSGGRLITVTPKPLPLTESAWATIPPADWNKVGSSWSSSNSNNAGGTPVELRVNYLGCVNGDKMISPPLNTAGLPYLVLRFKSYLSNFGAGCTLRVQSSSDGINWTNEAWSLQPMSGGTFGPSNVLTTINSNLSGGVTYVAFVLTGNPNQINDWYLDNVIISAPEPPTVTTASPTSITGNSAVSGGNVTDDATNPVTARGVCWSTSANPSLADSHTTDGSGLGPFVSNITSLNVGTTYHVRAYATNGVGTAYGNDIPFTTLGANVFNVTGGGTYCTGGTGLSVGLDGSQIATSYQLLKNTVAYGSPLPGTGNPLSWNNLSDGTYTVEATNTNGTTLMTGSAVITSLNNPVSISIVATATTTCPGIPITFTASPVNGGAAPVFQWKVNNVNAGTNNYQYTYNPGNGDQVKCILTSNIDCPSGNPATSNIITMTLAVPAPNLYGSTSECAGVTGVIYSTDAGAGISNYVWNVSAGGTIMAGGTSSSSSVTVTWNNAGAQTVSVNYTNITGCTAPLPTVKNVTVLPAPAPTISGPTPVCMNSTGNTYTTESGFSNYQWTIPAGGAVTAGGTAADNTVTVTWTGSGIKNVTVNYMSANGCYAAAATVKSVTVNPTLPVSVSVSASANPACEGNAVNFTANPVNGGTLPSYQWHVNGVNVGLDNPGYTYTPVNGDIITCTLNSNALCTTGNPATSSTITMTVNPILPVSVLITVTTNPVCSGSPATFTATPANGGSSPYYQWYKGGTLAFSSYGNTYSYAPANGDIITCVMTSNYLCPTGNPATSNAITMSVNLHPDAPLSGGNQTGCSNALPVTLSATAPAGSTVDWYNSSSGGSLLVANSNTYNASVAGNYYAESRDLTTGCKSTSRTAVQLVINTAIQYFLDNDGDGYGNPEVSQFSCVAIAGYVTNGLDCDDNDPNANPASQYLAFTGNPNFTGSIEYPLTGSPSTLFYFETDYFDASNVLPPAGYPRLMLDYEGNGSYLDANDRIVIMTAADPMDLTTTDGKRYFAEVNNLPYGSNWTSKIMVGAGGVCSTSFGPFNYPDILHQPNLYIFANDITFNPVHPNPTSPLTVTAVVHNESDFAAQNFVVHMLNQRFPSIVYADIPVANLPAHQNTTVQWNITTPDTASWCPTQIEVDYTNVINENNELDNSAVRPYTNGNYQVAGRIVVNSDVVPHISYENQYSYLNVSGDANYADFAVPLLDPSVAGATVDVTIAEIPGVTYSGYTNSWGDYSINFPAPNPAGFYHVTVSVTDYTLTGTDTTHFHIIPYIPPPPPPTYPNLTLNYCHSVDITPVNPHLAGGNVNLVAHVVNNGGATAVGPIEVQFTYSSGGTWTESFVGNLAAGQTVNITHLNAPLPPAGTTLTAYADPNNIVNNESNENASDNSSTDNMCYDFQPVGLCGGNFWGTYCMPSSGSLTIGLNVGLNVSHLYDADPVPIKFEVNGPGTGGWVTVGTGQLNNATRNCYCPWAVTCPNSFTFNTVGLYYFRMTVDPNNAYPECNESNNVLEVTVTVQNCAPPIYKPNLAISYCHSVDVQSVNPHLQGNVTLLAHVYNNGNATAVGTVANPIEVQFTYAGGFGTSTVPYVGNIASGQTVNFSIQTLRPPSGTLLTAYVDPANYIDEWNESSTDNSSTDNMCYDFQPVPHCGYNFWSRTYLVGQSASLSVGVNVFHLYDANPVKVRFEVSGPGIAGTQDLGNAILNNATRNCSCPWAVVLPFPFTFFNAGTYHFKMTTDPLNEYPECNEGNNVLEVDVTVMDGADMRVLSQFINPTPLNPNLNQPVSMIVSYENIGNSNVNDMMKLKVKVDNTVLSEVYPVPGLATGDHNSVAIPDTWSSNLPGAHAIRAIIDADNQVLETNETNNEATRAIIVGEAANLYFQLFASSNQHPAMHQNIQINARIGNNGDVNATANVKFYYLNDSNDTIPIGQTPVSVFAHDSGTIVMPWEVADNQTTIIGKITDVNTLEFNPDDNVATDIIGGFDVSIASTPACPNGNNGTLTATVTGGTAPFLYIWSNGYIGQTLTAGNGIYNVTVTDNMGLSLSVDDTIPVNSLPGPAGPISGVTPVLQGTNGVPFSVAPIANSTALVWAYSGTGVTINGSGPAITLNFSISATSGTLSVFGQNSCGNGAASFFDIFVESNVNPPVPFDVTGSGSYCEGTSGRPVGLSGSQLGVTYTLYKGGVAQVPTVSGTGGPISFGNKLVGTYTVSGTNTNGTTPMTGSAVVSVNPLPAAVAGANRSICANSSTTIGAAAVSGSSYSWTSVPTGFTSNLADPTVTPLITTSYILVETVIQTGCSNSHTVLVTVNQLPVPSLTGPTQVCVNSAGNVYTTDASMTSYQWTISPGGLITAGTGTRSITVTWNIPGAQWVEVSYQGISCPSVTKHYDLTVYPETVSGTVTGESVILFGMETTLSLEGSVGSVLKWQKRFEGGEWQDIPETNLTHTEIPDTIGLWDYRAEVRSGNCAAMFSDFFPVIVEPVTRTINLKVFLEGLYNPATSQMNKAKDVGGDKYPGTIADKIQVKVAKPFSPYSVCYVVNDVDLHQDGTCTITVPRTGYYYLVVMHRNSIETWSGLPVNAIPEPVYYDFSTSASQAYGDNQKQVPGRWVIWGGDVNQDGIVDSGDMNPVENASVAITVGYVVEDVNGDGIIDSGDMNIIENNSMDLITVIIP